MRHHACPMLEMYTLICVVETFRDAQSDQLILSVYKAVETVN
jgi:hypothetical protein